MFRLDSWLMMTHAWPPARATDKLSGIFMLGEIFTKDFLLTENLLNDNPVVNFMPLSCFESPSAPCIADHLYA